MERENGSMRYIDQTILDEFLRGFIEAGLIHWQFWALIIFVLIMLVAILHFIICPRINKRYYHVGSNTCIVCGMRVSSTERDYCLNHFIIYGGKTYCKEHKSLKYILKRRGTSVESEET